MKTNDKELSIIRKSLDRTENIYCPSILDKANIVYDDLVRAELLKSTDEQAIVAAIVEDLSNLDINNTYTTIENRIADRLKTIGAV